MKKIIFALVLAGAAQAQVSPIDGYQATDHPQDMLEIFWSKVKTLENDMKGKDCFKRANIWSYKLWKDNGVKSKKIFMHYTNKFNRELDNQGRTGISNRVSSLFSRNIAWDFHVAPAVTIEGVDYVLDPYLRKEAVTTIEWVEFLTKRGEYHLSKRKKRIIKELNKLKRKLRRAQRRSEDFGYERVRELKAEIAKIRKTMDYLEITEDPNQKLDIKCKKIDHIMEFDRNQDSQWCFYQETSMYYFATRELRFLNYGVLEGIDQRHPVQNLTHHNEENYRDGENFVVRRWNYGLLEQSLDEFKSLKRPESIYEI